MIGTAGATLAGLTFVAVTATERIVRERGNITPLRSHIDPSVLAFTLALFLSSVMLMPTLTPVVLGCISLACGLYYAGYNFFVIRQTDIRQLLRLFDRLDWFFFYILPLAASLLLILAGYLCLIGRIEEALTIIGVALLGLMLMGIRNALDMLMSSLKYTAQKPETPE